MAHGYAKAAGKPMLVMVHGDGRPAALVDGAVPGLGRPRAGRSSSSAITATRPASSTRRTARRTWARIVRDFVKFDDEATTLERFAESAMQAYRIAMTPPMGPVALVVPAELQESRSLDRARPHSGADDAVAAAGRDERRCARPRACS